MDEFTTVIVSISASTMACHYFCDERRISNRERKPRKTKSIPGGKPHWR